MTVLCAILCIVCFFDYKKQKIPNIFVLFVFLFGLGREGLSGGFQSILEYVLICLGILVLLFPIFRIGGLGAGDVKLLSVCAGYFPFDKIFPFLFISLLISALFSIIKLCKEQNVRDRIGYFCEYAFAVAKSGKWKLYLPQKNEKRMYGICMSGPILCSVLLGIGGVY